jgi:hypothetical protein
MDERRMFAREELPVEFNKRQYIELATELNKEGEPFPFPGIKDDIYMQSLRKRKSCILRAPM